MYTHANVLPDKADAISHNFCLGCGLCALNCPAHAIVMDEQACAGEQIRKSPGLAPQLCVHCGRCAAVCPSGTIQQYHMEDLLHRIQASAVKAVAFFCVNLNSGQPSVLDSGSIPADMSLMDARLRPRLQKVTVPEGVHLEEVRCTGRLGARFLLRCINAGVRDLAFFPCGPGQCQYSHGGTGVREHVDAVRDTLAQYGIKAVRLNVYEGITDSAELSAVLAGMKA